MVTFTCNNCGDSVKKNRVEKHFSFECKRKSGGPNLCCIDCLKDFRENYEAHTSCFTEDERYSAKGSFVAKEASNKQAKKQLSWSEIIQTVYDNANLDRTSKRILGLIKDVDNVPRKEAKFKNFCKNNGHLRQFKEIEISTVFSILQEESKKSQNTPTPIFKGKEINVEEVVEDKENNDKATQKRRHNDDDVKISKKLKTEVEVVVNCSSNKKKSKKNKDENNATSTVEESNERLTNGISKKKKKSKFIEEEQQPKMNGEKKKKKKNKEKCLENDVLETKKSKKEKNQAENEGGEDNESGKLNEGVGSIIKSPHRSKKDEPDRNKFRDIVLKLLKPGNEIKLKSLKKMVFATYKCNEEEVPREVRENFQKKISKIPNVTLNEKIVKLEA